jgi:ATP-binding cassette subfamily F protein 3
MLQVQHLRKSYGVDTTLADINFIVDDGEHVGLIGPNGAGKSTLLRCLVRQEEPDAGTIVLSPQMSIGYLPQTFDYMGNRTITEAIQMAEADLAAAESQLQQAAAQLTSATNIDAALTEYNRALEHFEALGGYEREHRAKQILHGLGLAEIEPTMRVATLSGGQKTRLGLAMLLLQEPDLLLLDEPTNHLDVEALRWLERFVQSYRRAVLIVSHDRAFLDQTVTRVLYLDPESRTIKSYTGNYSAFAAAQQHERDLHVETYKKQQQYIEHVERDIARLKGQALGVEASSTPRGQRDAKFFLGNRSGSKKVAKKAKARERKLERYLEADERVEKPKQHWSLKLDFGPAPEGSRAVLRMESVDFAYPGSPALLQDVTLDVHYGERIALVGPNGAGKTTLLRLIRGRLQPHSGQIRLGSNVRLGTLAQEHETLNLQRTVLQTTLAERPMSETEARSFLHFFLFGGNSVFRRVGDCSQGERSRLQFALLVLRGCNLLLLDEPLNHLDIEGREHFEAALNAFEGTVIAVAHDRMFLENFAKRVVEMRDQQVRDWGCDYSSYVAAIEQH